MNTIHLLHKEVGYMSALHYYGILSQIPKSVQIATAGHSRKLDTQIGQFEFFQIKP